MAATVIALGALAASTLVGLLIGRAMKVLADPMEKEPTP